MNVKFIVDQLFTKWLGSLSKRRHKRIPCAIKVHYFFGDEDANQRGTAFISDIHKNGLCLSNLKLYRGDVELKKGEKIMIYFSLSARDGSMVEFSLEGHVRYVLKSREGIIYRAGVELRDIPRKVYREFQNCLLHLTRYDEEQ